MNLNEGLREMIVTIKDENSVQIRLSAHVLHAEWIKTGRRKQVGCPYRRQFLDEVMGHMHQVLILLQVFLEATALLLLQQVKVIGCVKQGLDQTLP